MIPAIQGQILYEADPNGDYRYELYVLGVDGVQQLLETDESYSDHSAVWTPQGDRIAFVSNRDGVNQIYVMRSDGSGLYQLTNLHYGAESPTWSPDGSQIAFSGRTVYMDNIQFDIFVVHADGSNLVNLTNTDGEEIRPSWSPDGRQIAFSSWEGICVMNADGGNRRVIVPNGVRTQAFPAWSPNGERIAFHSYRADWQIYVVDSDGSNPMELTNLDFDVSRPVWSPDGQRIAFSGDRFFYLFDIQTGEIGRLVEGVASSWRE